MRRSTLGLVFLVMLILPVITLPSVKADPQPTTRPRTAIVRYSLFLKSNYSVSHDIDFVWSFRDTNWSKVTFQSSKPILAGSTTVDSQGQTVSKTAFDAIQAFGWRFEKAAPSDLLHVDFNVRVDVSSFSPSSIASSSVGKIEDRKSVV